MKHYIPDFLIVLKYQTPDGLYDYKCFDRQDYYSIKDFSEDLQSTKTDYEADGCKILWIREVVHYRNRM